MFPSPGRRFRDLTSFHITNRNGHILVAFDRSGSTNIFLLRVGTDQAGSGKYCVLGASVGRLSGFRWIDVDLARGQRLEQAVYWGLLGSPKIKGRKTPRYPFRRSSYAC